MIISRIALVSRSKDIETLRERLGDVAESHDRDDAVDPNVASRVAFVFGDDIDALIDAARTLYESEPVARAVLERCDSLLSSETGDGLLSVLTGTERLPVDPARSEPALYAIGCALTALWASVGIEPRVVVGTGSCEITAAQAAGALTLDDGMRLAVARGRAMSQTASSEASNGVEAVLQEIAINEPSSELLNPLTGAKTTADDMRDAGYWMREPNSTLSQNQALSLIEEQSIDIIVSLGHAISPKSTDKAVIGVPDVDGGFAECVGEAYEAGLKVDFKGLFAGEKRRRISVPGYPFQRRRHWV